MKLVLATTILLSLAAVASGQPADESRHTVVFRDVPLDQALAELVDRTGIELAYTARLVDGKRSACAARRLEAEALLRCVLEGTGLDFVRSSSGAYVLLALRGDPPRVRLAGRVVDADTGAPLPSAHVVLADGSAGTSADRNGLFALTGLLPGRQRLVASHVGYATAIVQSGRLAPGASRQLDVPLRRIRTETRPVVVDGLTSRLPSEVLGMGIRSSGGEEGRQPRRVREGTPLDVAEVSGIADVARGAAGVLGVSAALPLADVHVQGGSAAEHVTKLDGAPVRDPVALGRHLGAFSPLALGQMTVRKAGFGAEHGSALSAIVDLEHDLGAARPGVVFQADPLSLNARLATPLGDGGAVLVAARTSAWDAYRGPGLDDLLDRWSRFDPVLTGLWLGRPVVATDLASGTYRPDVQFSDLHAAARVRPDPFSTVTGSFYRARNHVSAERTAQDETGRLLGVRDDYDWTNWSATGSLSRLLGARAVAALRIRASDHRSDYGYRFGSGGSVAGADALLAALDGLRGADLSHRLTERAVEASTALSLGRGRELLASAGVEQIGAEVSAGNSFLEPFTVDEVAWLGTSHVGARLTRGRAVLEGGVRVTGVPSRATVYAEPRLSMRLDTDWPGVGPVAVRVASGLYRQYVNGLAIRSASPAAVVPEVFVWLPVADGVPAPRSLHLAADALALPGDRWTVRAEAFGRLDRDVAALDVPRLAAGSGGVLTVGEVVAPAEGSALGAGVRVERTGPRWSAAAAYSVERVRRSVPGRFDGRAVPVPWEAPHRLSAEARLAVGRGVSLAGAARAVWGRPWAARNAYFDYLLGPDAPAEATLLAATLDPFERLPLAADMDIAVVVVQPLGLGRVRAQAGIANVLNRPAIADRSARSLATPAMTLDRTLAGRRATLALRVTL